MESPESRFRRTHRPLKQTMNIAFIVNRFPKLSETFILDQITGLIALGHNVDIFAQKPGGDLKTHPDVDRYRLGEKTKYFSLMNGKPSFRQDDFWPNLWRHRSIALHAMNPLKYGRKNLKSHRLRTIFSLMNGYDIIHCQFGPNGNFGAFLNRKSACPENW